ncbi:hypothetical protein J3F84DRAFT_389207 [Trichoderma pleuroticola]
MLSLVSAVCIMCVKRAIPKPHAITHSLVPIGLGMDGTVTNRRWPAAWTWCLVLLYLCCRAKCYAGTKYPLSTTWYLSLDT